MILFRNFDIRDPWPGGFQGPGDVLVHPTGVIAETGREIQAPGARVIEGNKRLLVPGFCDTNANFGEPGLEYRETVITGSEAALAGGFTTVFIYPNTRPVIDSLQVFEYLKDKIENSPVRIEIVAALSKNCEGQLISPVKSFTDVGVKVFSDGYQPVQDAQFMKRASQYLSMYDALAVCLPQDKSLAANGVLNEGFQSIRLGLPGIPAISESVMIHRDAEIARETGIRIHFNNITTRAGIDAFIFHRERGANVTAGIAPFYFILSDENLDWYNTNFKLNPPLRSPGDVLAVADFLKSGGFDAICSSHTPQSEIEKTTDFLSAPVGAISLETTFPLAYTYLVKPGLISLTRLLELLIVSPRLRFGVEPNPLKKGSRADFVVIDPFETHSVLKETIRSKSRNTPFLNYKLASSVDMVFTRNQLHLMYEKTSSDYAAHT